MKNSLQTDVLIIGAGAAGVCAAVSAREAGADPLIIALDEVGAGGSTFSDISKGWGIQALVGEERSPAGLEAFYEDIIRVGLGHCRQALVRILVEESGACIERLLNWGLKFKKNSDGTFLRSKGCFSQQRRAFLTQDFENIRHVFTSILKQRGVRTVTGYVTQLIINDGECWGALYVDASGKILPIFAKSTILATGGGTGVYLHSMGNNRDCAAGCALACQAGARLNNLEFIQLALGLKKGSRPRFLPLNARSLKKIVDQDNQALGNCERFDPLMWATSLAERSEHMPFSCRSISALVDISIAGFVQSEKSIYQLNAMGEAELIELSHFAHAFNGGVVIDSKGASSLPGLFAAGEVAAGPHGADRIGGCMLTAALVFGHRSGRHAAERAGSIKIIDNGYRNNYEKLNIVKQNKILSQPCNSIAMEIKTAMQSHVAVLRTGKGLTACLNQLNDLQVRLAQKSVYQAMTVENYVKLEHLIVTAKRVAEAARLRKESIGGHFRKDFPPRHLNFFLNKDTGA